MEIMRLFFTYVELFEILRDFLFGSENENGQTDDKAAQTLSGNRISFAAAPDMILAGEDSRFIGSEFSPICNV